MLNVLVDIMIVYNDYSMQYLLKNSARLKYLISFVSFHASVKGYIVIRLISTEDENLFLIGHTIAFCPF